MSKKIVATGLALLLLLPIVAACGGSKKAANGIDPKAVQAAKVDPDKKYKIKVWDYPNGPNFQQFREEQIAAWKKDHPNVEVELEILTWAEGGQKMDVALNAGDPPDIYFQTPQTKFFDSGLAIPVEGFLTAEDKKDFTKASLGAGEYNGHNWLFPMWTSMQCWAGNRVLLEEAGVDWKKIQREGWTWDEFYEIAKKLTKEDNGYGKKQYGFLTYGDGEIVGHMMRNAGIHYQFTDKGEWLWTGAKAEGAVSFLRKMVDTGVLPKEMSAIDSKKMTDMYNNWEAAIWGRVGPYAITERENNIKNAKEGKITLPPQGVVDPVLLPFPHAKGEKQVPTVGMAGLYIFRHKDYKGDDHTKLVADLAHFLTSGRGGPELDGGLPAARLLIIPARKSSLPLLEVKANELNMGAENFAFLSHMVDLAIPPKFYTADINKISGKISTDVLRPNYQAFWANEISPKEFVENITKGANDLLATK